MGNLPLHSANSARPETASDGDTLALPQLERFLQGWFFACEMDCAVSTLALRRIYAKNLLWFFRKKKFEECGVMELRAFFSYIVNGHKEPGGRWGNAQQTKPVKPSTVLTYYRHLAAFFNWTVGEGGLTVSPMARIKVPRERQDSIEPFTAGQVEALLRAAKNARNAKRDEAIILFLLDTGIRVSELIALTFEDIDFETSQAVIQHGKGNKRRNVTIGRNLRKALWHYLKTDGRDPKEAVFLSERGDALTRSGAQQIIERLGKAAKLSAVRCSPHTFRHTFAVMFLRNGGNQFSLMAMLGHTTLNMTAKYVKIAQADATAQHRQFSPADNLKKEIGR